MGVPSRTSAPTRLLIRTNWTSDHLGKVRPPARLAEAHPQVLIIALRAAVALLAVSKDAVGSPGVSNASNGGLGEPSVGNTTDDDSDDTNPHPKSHRYADAGGSKLTLPLVRPQAKPSLFGTTVPEGTDGSAAGTPGAGAVVGCWRHQSRS